MKCLYCEKEFKSGESREHIIPNNIAGRLEGDICCPSCNGYLGKTIDKEFQETFRFIIGNLATIRGTRKLSSRSVELKAYNIIDQKEYIIIKTGGKYFCSEYGKLYRKDINEHIKDFLFIGNPVNLNNQVFRKGLEKIALNFAYYKGVSRGTLTHMFNVNDGKPEIVCLHNVHAFYPIEKVIRDIELSKDNFRLFHQLHLFNINKRLCCYISLFNVFQYFVVVSEDYAGNDIDEWYSQYIEEIETIKKLGYKCNDDYSFDCSTYLKESFDYSMNSDFKKIISSPFNNQNFLGILHSTTDILGLGYSRIDYSLAVTHYSPYILNYMKESDAVRFRATKLLLEKTEEDIRKYCYAKFGLLSDYIDSPPY